MHEAQGASSSCFITLTYDQAELPDGGTLVVKHWQDFAKRLRHKIGPFRFFHCGEYGDDTFRPHGHACIFGTDFSFDRKYLKKTKEGHTLYTSETLDEAWTHGFCNIGSFSFETAAYVARYIMKKQTGPLAEGYYERFSLQTGEVFNIKPPYVTMSRRPGIGANWFKKYKGDVFPSDEVIINAQKTRPPTYYDTLLDKCDPDELDRIKQRRITRAARHARNNTAARLRVREITQQRKLTKFTRDQI